MGECGWEMGEGAGRGLKREVELSSRGPSRSIQLDTKLVNGLIVDLQKDLQAFEVKSF